MRRTLGPSTTSLGGRRGALIGPCLAAVALVAAIAAGLLPWWSYSSSWESIPPQVSTRTLYVAGFMQFVQTAPNAWSYVCTFGGSSSNPQDYCAPLSSTNTLYTASYLLVLLAVLLLATTLGLTVMARPLGPGSRVRAALSAVLPATAGTSVLGAALAIGTGQPGAFWSDSTGYPSGNFGGDWTCGSSPLTSFAGSCSAVNIHFQWGPSVGWYLALAAGILALLAATMVYLTERRRALRRPPP